MGWKTVVLTDEEKKGNAGDGDKFRKFKLIGDTHLGIYLGVHSEVRDFNDGKGPQNRKKHVFWAGKDGEFQLDSAFDLDRQITKAQKPVSEGGFGLKAYDGTGRPHVVRTKWTGTQDIKRENPMKLFQVDVDTEPNIPAGTRVPTLAELYPPQRAAQGPQPTQNSPSQRQPNPPPPDDDIPF